ncbi:hypothetical protein MRX96_024497 [Rhipicephalus microplus]
MKTLSSPSGKANLLLSSLQGCSQCLLALKSVNSGGWTHQSLLIVPAPDLFDNFGLKRHQRAPSSVVVVAWEVTQASPASPSGKRRNLEWSLCGTASPPFTERLVGCEGVGRQ